MESKEICPEGLWCANMDTCSAFHYPHVAAGAGYDFMESGNGHEDVNRIGFEDLNLNVEEHKAKEETKSVWQNLWTSTKGLISFSTKHKKHNANELLKARMESMPLIHELLHKISDLEKEAHLYQHRFMTIETSFLDLADADSDEKRNKVMASFRQRFVDGAFIAQFCVAIEDLCSCPPSKITSNVVQTTVDTLYNLCKDVGVVKLFVYLILLLNFDIEKGVHNNRTRKLPVQMLSHVLAVAEEKGNLEDGYFVYDTKTSKNEVQNKRELYARTIIGQVNTIRPKTEYVKWHEPNLLDKSSTLYKSKTYQTFMRCCVEFARKSINHIKVQGIYNPQNFCFMISAIQMLSNIEVFRTQLELDTSGDAVLRETLNLIKYAMKDTQLQRSQVEKKMKCILSDPRVGMNPHEQQDSSEFMTKLFGILGSLGLLHYDFLLQNVTYLNGRFSSTTCFPIGIIETGGFTSIQLAVTHKLLRTHSVTDGGAERLDFITQIPKFLILSLNERLQFNGFEAQRNWSRIRVNMTLFLQDSVQYELVGAITHEGSALRGHFMCLKKIGGGVWICVNDQSVYFVALTEVSEMLDGGREVGPLAYILLYKRVD